jgi:hypothetical protein
MVNNSIGGEKTKKPINSGNRLQQLTEKAGQTGSQAVQAGPGPRKCRTGYVEMWERVSGRGIVFVQYSQRAVTDKKGNKIFLIF